MELKIGSINLQGSRAWTEEVWTEACRGRYDFVLTQEHYHGDDRVLGGGGGAMAGVMAINQRVACAIIPDLSDRYRCVVHVGTDEAGVFLISAYFRFSDPIDPHLEGLGRTLQLLSGRRVVICADTNTHSPLWFSRSEGRGRDAAIRRQMLEALIAEHDLQIWNEPDQPCTFAGPMGQSNIDVTLSSANVRVEDWCVLPDSSSSDHRLIQFRITQARQNDELPSDAKLVKRYKTGTEDWHELECYLRDHAGYTTDARNAEGCIDNLCSVLENACKVHLGEASCRKSKAAQWWSTECDQQRSRCAGLRRRYYRCRERWGVEGSEQARNEWRMAKRDFKRTMKSARTEYIRRLATDLGNSDPWGIVYRTASGRRPAQASVITGVDMGGRPSHDVSAAMHHVLEALLPGDDPSCDTAYHTCQQL